MTLRPGQLEPNEFELAILHRIAEDESSLRPLLLRLHVLSREYTGVGCFTNFLHEEHAHEPARRVLDLNAVITIPGVPNGLGAVLFLEDNHPAFLEVVSFGEDHWDGRFDGFSIGRAD